MEELLVRDTATIVGLERIEVCEKTVEDCVIRAISSGQDAQLMVAADAAVCQVIGTDDQELIRL